MADNNFAWLIEAPGNNYLGARNIAHTPEFYWTKDHNKALNFCSAEQANDTMMAIRALSPTLFEFARTLGDAMVTEYGWLVAKEQNNG